MKISAKILSFLIFLLTNVLSYAVPAYPRPRGVTNPDGSEVTLRLLGDEYGHVTVDADGRVMSQDADGNWRAVPEASVKSMTTRSRRTRKVNRSSFPCRGEVRSLIVLVDFPDIRFSTDLIYDEVDQMLNLPGFDRREHIGCAADYFRAQSQGLFDPSFDVYGPVRASKSATYYGQNDGNGDDMYAHELAIEICRALDGQIDFSRYDLDEDGQIDNLYFFYAGYGENFAGNKAAWIWPHADHIDSYDIPASERTFDGKVLNSYGCCAELYGSTGTDITAIGTFCHEFGHILGLPDTYDVNYSDDGSTYHPDQWDVMASGSYLPLTRNSGAVPAGYSALERWLLGWAEPIDISAAQSVELQALQSTGMSVRVSTADPDEFFLIENRQQSGYDRYLPSHGMLAWHIDRRPSAYISVTLGGENKTISCSDAWSLDYNAINCNPTHPCLEIEKASGNDGSKTSQDTPFPGRQLRTSFTDATSPSMRSWSGAPTGKPITNITERSGVIAFDFMGGGEAISVAAPTLTEVSATGFTAHWDAVAQATAGYEVKLYGVERTTEADAATIDAAMGSVPSGWTLTGEAAYSGSVTTLGGTSASSLTTPALDLSKGGTLTIRAAQTGSSAATLKVYAGDEFVDQYIPTEQASDYVIEIPSSDATTLSIAVDRRKTVAIERMTLRQSVEHVNATLLKSAREQGTSHSFSGLEEGREYAVSVGVAGYVSALSPLLFVTIGAPSGIENIIEGTAAIEYYDLRGFRTDNPSQGNIYIKKQGNKTFKCKK